DAQRAQALDVPDHFLPGQGLALAHLGAERQDAALDQREPQRIGPRGKAADRMARGACQHLAPRPARERPAYLLARADPRGLLGPLEVATGAARVGAVPGAPGREEGERIHRGGLLPAL